MTINKVLKITFLFLLINTIIIHAYANDLLISPKLKIIYLSSLSYGTNGIEIRNSVSIDSQIEYLKLSLSAGLNYYSDYLSIGKGGVESRISGLLSITDNDYGLSIGTNFWNGFGINEAYSQ